MNEIIKQAEPITLMYYVKRAILLYERVFGHYPAADPVDLMSLYGVETQPEFEAICKRIESELKAKVQSATISDEDKEFLADINYESFIELAENGDFELITDKYHRRKFFNEIPNEAIVDALITAFERIWEIPQEGPYFVSVYDLADEALFFDNYDDLCSFIHNYEVTPYTVFEVKEHVSVELYSA